MVAWELDWELAALIPTDLYMPGLFDSFIDPGAVQVERDIQTA